MAVRNVRRDGMDTLEEAWKRISEISQDEHKVRSGPTSIQDHDRRAHCKLIDAIACPVKKTEIMQV